MKWTAAALLVVIVGCESANLNVPPAASRLQVREVMRRTYPDGWSDQYYQMFCWGISENHCFQIITEKGQRFFVLDGQKTDPVLEELDEHVWPCYLWSSTSRNIYRISRGGKYAAVIDGKLEPTYDRVQTFMSPDGKRVGYIAKDADKSFVVVDGVKGATFSEIEAFHVTSGYQIFTPDSQHVVYCAWNESSAFIVRDDKRLPALGYPDFRMVKMNPDGTRFTYPTIGAGDGLVQDGRKLASGVKIESYDVRGEHLAYAGRAGESAANVFVADGKVGPLEGASNASAQLSPDGRHWTYVGLKKKPDDARRGLFDDIHCVVHDGEVSQPWDNVPVLNGPVFSPDSHRLAYVASMGEKEQERWFVVIDGKVSPAYDGKGADIVSSNNGSAGVALDSLQFSSDSKHIAYVARDKGKHFLVLDGVPSRRYDGIASRHSFGRGSRLIFSPFSKDGQHVLYFAQDGGKWFPVLDGKQGLGFDCVMGKIEGPQSYALSPDGKHLVYVARIAREEQAATTQPEISRVWSSGFEDGPGPDEKDVVIVDNQIVGEYDLVTPRGPLFDAEGQVDFLAFKGRTLVRVKVDFEP